MRSFIFLAALLAATSLSAVAQVSKSHGPEEELRRLNAEELDGLMRNDIKTLKPLWSDDFVVTNPFNKFVNKQQVLDMVENGTLAIKAYDRQIGRWQEVARHANIIVQR